ncbi:hypothetical protein PAENIP36_43010 [Paenibacillus sp. P36]
MRSALFLFIAIEIRIKNKNIAIIGNYLLKNDKLYVKLKSKMMK